MPSPFPGMDPYLEGSFWSPVHHSLAEEILRLLAPRLRPRYVALPEERFVVEIQETRSDIYPDGGVTPSEIAEVGAERQPLRMPTIIPSPVPLVTVQVPLAGGDMAGLLHLVTVGGGSKARVPASPDPSDTPPSSASAAASLAASAAASAVAPSSLQPTARIRASVRDR